MNKSGFKNDDLPNQIEALNIKVAKRCYDLLCATHNNEKVFKDVQRKLLGETCLKALPILIEELQKNKGISERVCLKTTKQTQEVLRKQGNAFAAPAFLELCSPNLMDLDLSTLWIKHVLPSIGQLKDLTHLDLSYNRFRTLPDAIGKLKSLRILNLDMCPVLNKIPETIGGCTALVKLIASKTAITDLPESLGTLENLREVNVLNSKYNPNRSAVYPILLKKGVEVKVGPQIAEVSSEAGSSRTTDHSEQLADRLSELVMRGMLEKRFHKEGQASRTEEQGIECINQ